MAQRTSDMQPPAPPHAVRHNHLVVDTQDRIATALGVSRARRIERVVAMLDNNARRAPGYWIQLFLAMGIATVGLALGSTAVVIGAMLVSPLMGPIVELGMGFAVGSSLLVLRAALRVALSVAGVVLGAAILTLMLPFHEVTGEIAARTAPTALDLLVAVFCALTASYTTVREGADTTAAAAGTAIGIALVPPLCVIGFGLGTASWSIASGAALLFTANFSAILVFAVVSFLLLGFNQVEAMVLERDYLEHDGTETERAAERAHRALRALFGSRYGVAMRLVIPLDFLAIVYVPLGQALDDVSWEVRVRTSIRRILDGEEGTRAVQTALSVERQAVALRLLVIGTPEQAERLQRRLEERITKVAGLVPTVSVIAVPDAAARAAAAASESRAGSPVVAPPGLREAAAHLGEVLRAGWPAAAGPLVGWRLALAPSGEPRVTAHHLGQPLGLAGEQLLARALSGQLGQTVRVVDAPLPSAPLVAATGEDAQWLVRALDVGAELAGLDGVVACVRGPIPADGRGGSIDRTIHAALLATPAAREGRLALSRDARWSLRVARGSCETIELAPPRLAVPPAAR
jgi:uncharacterized hydrophobic protein (TIGR00271 family)